MHAFMHPSQTSSSMSQRRACSRSKDVHTRYHEPLYRDSFPGGRMSLLHPGEASPEPCLTYILQRGSPCIIPSQATSALLHSHTFWIEMLRYKVTTILGGHHHWPTFLTPPPNFGGSVPSKVKEPHALMHVRSWEGWSFSKSSVSVDPLTLQACLARAGLLCRPSRYCSPFGPLLSCWKGEAPIVSK